MIVCTYPSIPPPSLMFPCPSSFFLPCFNLKNLQDVCWYPDFWKCLTLLNCYINVQYLFQLALLHIIFSHFLFCWKRCISSFLVAISYSTVYKYHILLIHLSTEDDLDCFSVLNTINNAAVNIVGHVVYFVSFIFCGYMTQSEELLGHMELLFSFFFIFLETRFFFFPLWD